MSELLTTGDVAERAGCSVRTAYRLMLDAHQKHGGAVVARRGRRLVTTEEALAKVFPSLGLTRTERRLASLEKQAKDADQRADAMADELRAVRAELRTFREHARAWFARHSSAKTSENA